MVNRSSTRQNQGFELIVFIIIGPLYIVFKKFFTSRTVAIHKNNRPLHENLGFTVTCMFLRFNLGLGYRVKNWILLQDMNLWIASLATFF